MVTAKHVIAGCQDGDVLEIYRENNWHSFRAVIVGHYSNADVSVFVLPIVISSHPMPPTSVNLVYGQDVYFLGFPFGAQDMTNPELNREFPMPYVKKAIVSSMPYQPNGRFFFLDGINNPGFSGGPVVFRENGNPEFRACGIISGYRFNNESVYQNDTQLELFVKVNTGIVIAYDISNAIELIDANPIGMEI